MNIEPHYFCLQTIFLHIMKDFETHPLFLCNWRLKLYTSLFNENNGNNTLSVLCSSDSRYTVGAKLFCNWPKTKRMTMHGVFHSKASTARLYTSRKKEEVCTASSFISAGKQIVTHWHKGVSEVANMARTYQWLNKINIRANTEDLIMAAQEKALNTRAVAQKIYHTVQDSRCRLCTQHSETVEHIISGCSKLTRTDCTMRCNNVASIVYRAVYLEYNLYHSKDWWIEPEKVVRNNHVKILWGLPYPNRQASASQSA